MRINTLNKYDLNSILINCMCSIASLFDLIEEPCKSMWNSPVEVDLFSSAIFKVHFSANFGLFSQDYLYLCVVPYFTIGLLWPVQQRSPNHLRMSQPESPLLILQMRSTGIEICLLNMVSKSLFSHFSS